MNLKINNMKLLKIISLNLIAIILSTVFFGFLTINSAYAQNTEVNLPSKNKLY